MPTTDRASLKIAWVKWPSPQPSSRTDLLGNMPRVRGRVIEIEICSRSHCWFPLRAWLKTSALRDSPKTNCLWRVGAIPALRDFPLGQRLVHFHPFAPSRFESIRVFQCPGLRVQWIARLLCHNACNFSVGNGLRGRLLLGPFQQRFRKHGLAFVPTLSSIDQTIGPPMPVRT